MTSMTQHTPGPWYYVSHDSNPDFFAGDEFDSPECWSIVAGGLPPEDVDYVAGGDGRNALRPDTADALLIVAAPDLLAALKMFVADPDDTRNRRAAYVAARAAIAKAEGSVTS